MTEVEVRRLLAAAVAEDEAAREAHRTALVELRTAQRTLEETEARGQRATMAVSAVRLALRALFGREE